MLDDASNIKEVYFYARGKTYYQSLDFQYIQPTMPPCRNTVQDQQVLMAGIGDIKFSKKSDFMECFQKKNEQ